MTGLQIKQWRVKNGLTHANLAQKVGVCEHTIQRWEKGIFSPSHLNLYKLQQLMEPEVNNEAQPN